MEEMKLIGSRNLCINNENADWDYAILDLEEGGTFRHIQNDHFDYRKHCYHYNYDYRYKVARFEIDDINDWQFVYNPEDYKAGLIDVNPLDYKDQWIERLKQLDFYNWYWFNTRLHKPLKRVYHLAYNLEVLKEHTVNVSEMALGRVKRWHDGQCTLQDYEDLIEQIKAL